MSSQTMRRGYVDTRDGQLHYRSAGEGRPLVLLHQSPSSGAMWEPVVPVFGARGYRTIAFDAPGFGMSYVPDAPPDMSYYAARIVEAAEGLGLGQFDVVGHHTGVTIALTIADEHPNAVRKLALWGVPMMDDDMMHRLATEAPAVYTMSGEEVLNAWRSRGRMNPNFTVEMAIRCLIEKLQLGDHSQWGHNAVGVVDHRALVQRVAQPTLVLCSELDGRLWEPSKEAARIMPNGRYHDLPGRSLDVADEAPEEFVDAIDRFLRE